jgi:hypothetical protein
MVLIGGAEDWAAIQWERSIWLRKRGSGDHVRWEIISSNYV